MQQSTIDDIITAIIKRESPRYTNDSVDPGGPTKFGITLATLRRWRKNRRLQAADVKALKREEAAAIYEDLYILAPGFHLLGPAAHPVARLLIDTGVLHGQAVAVRMFQRAVGAKVDGKLGPKTRARAQELEVRPVLNHVIKQRVNREIEKVLADVKKKFGPRVRKTTKLKYLRGWVVGRTLKEFL